jgi:hypothetical protein
VAVNEDGRESKRTKEWEEEEVEENKARRKN